MFESMHHETSTESTFSLFGVDIQCREVIPKLNESQLQEMYDSFYDDENVSPMPNHTSDLELENKIKILTFLPIYVLVFIIGMVGNILVIYLILKVKKLRSVTSLFLMSLAAADLLLIFICVPIKITEFMTHGWIFGKATCKLFHYLHTFTAICSVMNLTAMSLERYFAIIHPLKAKIRCTYRRAKIIIVFIWICSFIAALPILLGKNIEQRGFGPDTTDVCLRVWCSKIWKIFEVYRTLIILVIPFTILVYCYVRICLELYKMPLIMKKKTENETRLQQFDQSTATNKIDNSSPLIKGKNELSHPLSGKNASFRSSADDESTRRQIIRILMSIVVIFFICWAPIMIENILKAFDVTGIRNVGNRWYIRVIFHLLAYINSCVNPIVYGFMSKRFREGFRVAFCTSNTENQYASIELKTTETNSRKHLTIRA